MESIGGVEPSEEYLRRPRGGISTEKVEGHRV